MSVAVPLSRATPGILALPSYIGLFVYWLVLRTLAWLAVACMQPNPPLDTVEWVAWGQHWQLGYHKHPPLAAWLAELAHWATGSFAGVYALGYACVALALWCVWRVARDVLPPRLALLSVLCLDGLTFLTRDAAEFNNQVLLIAFWASAVWCTWRAANEDRWGWWVGAGTAVGLCLWCKYTAVFLALSMTAFWLCHDHRRWTRIVLAAVVAAVVFAPHVVWMVTHDFATLRYAADRAAGEGANQWFSVLSFCVGQTLRLTLMALPLLPLAVSRLAVCGFASGTFPEANPQAGKTSLARRFLLFMVAGPVVLHVLVALLMNGQMRDIWGVPLWTFASVALLCLVSMKDNERVWRLSLGIWIVVALGMLSVTLFANVAGRAVRQRALRIHYPGQRLADEVTACWRQEHNSPLPIVAGDWWLAACVCVHSADRPTLFGSREPARLEMHQLREPELYYLPDHRASPWVGEEELQRRGGVLLWDASVFGDEMPAGLREAYPTAQPRQVIELPFVSGSQKLRVGCAMIVP